MYKNYQNYDVQQDGRIWSKKSKKFLKPYTRPNGYQIVSLFDNNGKRDMQYVHRVTWVAVNGREVPEGMQLNHIDEDKTNNAISNLEIVTPKDNSNYGTRNERVSKANTNHPDKSKRVGAFKNSELVMVFPSTAEAHRNGFHSGNVCRCCRNCYMREGNNKYKDYEWRYLDGEEN